MINLSANFTDPFTECEPRFQDGGFRSRLNILESQIASDTFTNGNPQAYDRWQDYKPLARAALIGKFRGTGQGGLSLLELDEQRWRNAFVQPDQESAEKCLSARNGLPDDRLVYRKLMAGRMTDDAWFASLSDEAKQLIRKANGG